MEKTRKEVTNYFLEIIEILEKKEITPQYKFENDGDGYFNYEVSFTYNYCGITLNARWEDEFYNNIYVDFGLFNTENCNHGYILGSSYYNFNKSPQELIHEVLNHKELTDAVLIDKTLTELKEKISNKTLIKIMASGI